MIYWSPVTCLLFLWWWFLVIITSRYYKGLFDALFSSFSGVHSPQILSRNCLHFRLEGADYPCGDNSMLLPNASSGPTQPSSKGGLRLQLAHAAARNCPWQQDTASLKVTPLPEDSREPMISWCGDMKTGPFASIWHTPEKSSQSRGPWRQVQLRPPSQLHCGPAPPAQCLPHFIQWCLPKWLANESSTYNWLRVGFKEPNLRYYN